MRALLTGLLVLPGCTLGVEGMAPPLRPASGSPVTAGEGGALGLDPDRVPVLEEDAACPEGALVTRAGEGWACTPAPGVPEHDHAYATADDLEARLAARGEAPAWAELADPEEGGCPARGVLRRAAGDDGWVCRSLEHGTEPLVEARVAQLTDDDPTTTPVDVAGLTGAPAGLLDGDDDGLADLGCEDGEVPARGAAGWECRGDEDTTYSGADFAVSGRVCESGGTRVAGFDAAGAPVCEAPADPVPALTARVLALETRAADLCARACDGRECGDDGCGGSCGGCDAWEECHGGRCEPAVDVPDGWVLVPPGTFTMGSPGAEPGRGGDEAEREVEVTRPFLLKATEVTQGEWRAVLGANPSRFLACGPRCPVEQVTWYEAVVFCNLLSLAHGLSPCYGDEGGGVYGPNNVASGTEPTWPDGLGCEGFRLPTEAEWEYAARAGTAGPTYAAPGFSGGGGPESCNLPVVHPIGWYCGNSGVSYADASDTTGPSWEGQQFPADWSGTHPVGQKLDNPWGLRDVLGNVGELVWDRYGAYGGAAPDPLGPDAGEQRIVRGGSWNAWAGVLRAAGRAGVDPAERHNGRGLRPARTVP